MAGVSTVNTNLTVEQPNRMSIGDMLNIARGVQEYKQAQALNPLAIEEAKAKLSTSQTGAEKARRTLEPEVSQAESLAKGALQTTESGGLDLATKKQKAIAQNYVTFMFDPDVVQAANNPSKVDTKTLVKKVTDWGILQGKETGIDEETTKKLIQPYIDIAQNNPQELQNYLKQRHILGVSPEQVKGEITPSGIEVSNNQQRKVINTNPFANNVRQGEAISGTETNLLPPVGSKAIAQSNDKSNFAPGTEYTLPTSGSPSYVTALPQSFVDKQAIVTEDFKNVQQQASGAQATVGILQDLKELAPKAATGAGADRKAFAIKAAAALGIKVDPQTMNEAAYTDLFNKESNMLSNMPGMTDAARAMSVMSNPNNKMDIRAIQKAADLLIARNKMILLEQGVKSKLQNQPDIYLDVKEKLDRIKDPRAIAFMSMPAEDKKNIWAGLAIDSNGKAAPKGSDGLTSEQREFKHKVDSLRTLDNQYNLGLTK